MIYVQNTVRSKRWRKKLAWDVIHLVAPFATGRSGEFLVVGFRMSGGLSVAPVPDIPSEQTSTDGFLAKNLKLLGTSTRKARLS